MKFKYNSIDEMLTEDARLTYSYDDQDKNLVKELKDAYDTFLNMYIKLNENLELKNPLGVFSLFTMLLWDGYLSYNKSYNPNDEDFICILVNDNLEGINILNGKGVCRHTSSLLSDIYTKLGINNRKLGCYVYNPNEKNHFKKIKNYLETVKDIGILDAFKLPYIEVISNHSILEVSQDKKYYLDSMNSESVEPKNNNSPIFKTSGNYEILTNSKENSNYSTIKEYFEERKRVKNIYNLNKSLFDDFYFSNKDIYSLINDRVKILKKKEKIY